jgi:hypothetical protein
LEHFILYATTNFIVLIVKYFPDFGALIEKSYLIFEYTFAGDSDMHDYAPLVEETIDVASDLYA